MLKFDLNYQNVVDGQGMELAMAGMLIVFVVLALISLFIALLPRILSVVARRYPEEAGYRVAGSGDETTGEGEILAAIGYVLHSRAQKSG